MTGKSVNAGAAFVQELADCRDTSLVGGKATNLGRLVRAGFPVPDGFVVTTRGYRHARGSPSNGNGNGHAAHLPDDLAEQVRTAYRALGGGPVAVRSSATAEDMAAASMAGQYETFLDVRGEVDLLDAVGRCWASLDSPRTRAYLATHGIDAAQVAMAVVVQQLVPADVAGVLFTANPQTGTRQEMLVEASWGLGESVVSGRVQPDVLRVDGATGRVLAATIADKRVYLPAGGDRAGGEQLVDEDRRRRSCLRSADVARLWRLGRRAAEHFGAPQDLEWAIRGDELFLLQSRPITTLADAEAYEECLRATRADLREKLAAGRGPWVLHNLAETLPHPTPLTWSVVGRFMSGDGGYGAMHRLVGFEPSPVVAREGFLDRVAGRVYMDCARAAEMFFADYPFAYDPEQLRGSPDAGQAPPTVPTGTFVQRVRVGRKLGGVQAKLRELAEHFDATLTNDLTPAFAGWVRAEKQRDLPALSAESLIDLWHERERKVLGEFAPQSLLPSLITGMALAELRALVDELFWDEDPDALAQLLSSGGEPDHTVRVDAELFEVAEARRPLVTWVADHGHRAAGEFDLAAPRWREQPDRVAEMAGRLKGGINPIERHRAHAAKVDGRLAELRAGLAPHDRVELDRRAALVRRYVGFREGGKDALMLGYDLLRDLALEAGRRLEIGEDVFYLTREDLFDALRVGFAPHHLIGERKAAHGAESRVVLPQLIDAAAIETLGEPPAAAASSAGSHKAFAVSAGEAAGPARVVRSPEAAGELGRGYVLVCPSTDPSWTPLFVNAAALVLECGGSLSHGAVVAREMGLPAVVLPDATRLFQDGETIRVDGRRGTVGRVNDDDLVTSSAPVEAPDADPDDVHVARDRTPPPPGRRDRTAATVRNIAGSGWIAFLLAAFLLPETWLLQPSLRVLDLFLWPFVRALGRGTTVVLVAAGLAAATMLIQRFLTDNRRLLAAKRRAAALTRDAAKLPDGSPRRQALAALATPVQWRVTAAAFVPLAVLLGPMILSFSWLKERMDPAAWNVPAGSSVNVVATIDSNLRAPVMILPGRPLFVDDATPDTRTLPPIREKLEKLLSQYKRPSALPDEPWELKAAADAAREDTIADLRAYLDGGVPPQALTWTLRGAEGASGRFPVNVAVMGPSGGSATHVDVVLGDAAPPAPAEVGGPAGSPIKSLKVVYPRRQERPIHWGPLARFAKPSWDAWWWLPLYLLAYLPVMFVTRAVLRVA